ncbi:MAG: aconitase family protein [bacterium]
MPTKAELIQLQKLYRTDEKIGERLGGVPAYLVAYWRRKKGVPLHSLPKFSESEVRNLWERYGDDDRCGLELGISKAAFYNWRRRYGLREKPAFLKLEQLELNFPGLKTAGRSTSLYGQRTVVEKIIARTAGLDKVTAGELVMVQPDLVMSHDDTYDIIEMFRQVGVEYVFNPNRIVISLSCRGNDGTNKLARSHQVIREFVRRQGIKSFFDIGQGNSHQLVLENGGILPGQLGLGTDRQSTLHGALGAFGTGIEVPEMAALWATGQTWLKVPYTLRIDIAGRRPPRVHACDIALAIIKRLGTGGAEYKAIEYYGPAVSQMNIADRATLSGLSVDLGAKAAICPYEAVTRRYLSGQAVPQYSAVIADKDARYDEMFQINIGRLLPQIAGPEGSGDIRAAAELDGLPVQQVIIGSGNGGRFSDLRATAEILRGKKVHPDCRVMIVPASRSVYLDALKKGLIRVFLEAGVVVANPGYNISSDDARGMLAPGERCLTTADWDCHRPTDDEGREVFLCSAATAAASALNAAVTDPTGYGR